MKKSLLFVLFSVVCFCVFYGIRYIENPVATQPAIYEVYEQKIDTMGYIVRNEQVYNAPASGTVYHYVQEGTRVSRNSALSTVYTGEISEATLQELNNINKKIYEIESGGNKDAFSSAGYSNEGDIENIKDNIIAAARNDNIEKIAEYKAHINSVVTGDSKNVYTNNLQELKDRKWQLETSINSGKRDIYSQMSGVFSKNVDGLEGILSPNAVLKYKLEDYLKLSSTVKEQAITESNAVCKVVNNYTWYVVMAIDRTTAEDLNVGKSVKVRFDEIPGIEADATIAYISTEDSGTNKNVVVVKCEQYKEGVFSLRYSGVELILKSYEGYRIPISAIHVDGNKKGVLVRNGGTQVFKPCNVVYTDTERQTVIISPVSGERQLLREYDNIVVGEK